MKDSGVEWIGEIPKNWDVRKFNAVAETITDFVASGGADVFLDFKRPTLDFFCSLTGSYLQVIA